METFLCHTFCFSMTTSFLEDGLGRDMENMKEVMVLLCCAIGVMVNGSKSTTSLCGIEKEDVAFFMNLFP